MKQIDIHHQGEEFPINGDKEALGKALVMRKEAAPLLEQEKYLESMEKTVAALRELRAFPDYDDPEFRLILAALLFDLAEIHYGLKNFKQSEKELEVLFKVIDALVRLDEERFGRLHILAMELTTRIIRSRKKAMELLVRQQINADKLYEKVNAGVEAATDRLVDTLRSVGELMASTGDIKGALKFYAEAIRISKKKTRRVSRKEIKMTIEMAEIMMRLRSMQPRARRLLNAVLPHAIAHETIELEQQILSLIQMIDTETEPETKWKLFIHKITQATKSRLSKKK